MQLFAARSKRGYVEVNGQVHAPAVLPPGPREKPPAPIVQDIGGPLSRSRRFGEEKNPLPLRGFDPWFVQPVVLPVNSMQFFRLTQALLQMVI